jgi:hypothetical protein
MASRSPNQAWSKYLDAGKIATTEIQTAIVAHLKKNLIIRIFCLSGWISVLINPEKWSSTVHIYIYIYIYICTRYSTLNRNTNTPEPDRRQHEGLASCVIAQ